MRKTRLNLQHRRTGAKMVDFAGWEMPLHYGSQVQEHRSVRRSAGLFDVSHMAVVDVPADCSEALHRLFANDLNRLAAPGQALYTAMLNASGGVIDDLIVYRLGSCYRMVFNAARERTDLAHLHRHLPEAAVRLRRDLNILALQGPEAGSILGRARPDLAEAIDGAGPFRCAQVGEALIGTTGYTGEAGFELIVPAERAEALWAELTRAGAAPVGLAARDTLRLEAGLNLYGHEMDEGIHPMRANLGWSIPLDRHSDFIGSEAVRDRAPALDDRLAGLVLEGRGVLRQGQRLFADGADIEQDSPCGIVTSGGFSPTLECSIALARIGCAVERTCAVEIRGRLEAVRIVRPRFVWRGKNVIKDEEATP